MSQAAAETPASPLPAAYPSLWRRLAAMVYEALLVGAILIVAGFLFGAATQKMTGAAQLLFRLYLIVVLGAYFIWCWHRGGRTLAMKAWRLRLATPDGATPGLGRAALRFGIALPLLGATMVGLLLLRGHAGEWTTWLLLLPGCLSVLWALVDREKQFLHDRLAGTRLFLVDAATPR